METQTQIRSALTRMANVQIQSWHGIHEVLDSLSRNSVSDQNSELRVRVSGGVGFLTFAYGIDGVTMEIAKYAACVEKLFRQQGVDIPVHLIGGDFSELAGKVLVSRWSRHTLPGADGWSKWDGGKWFAGMFYEDMPEDSGRSSDIAAEIWHQALRLTEGIIDIALEAGLGFLVVVNTNSNPGNLAIALAAVLASEITHLPVLNSSHDFFWEDGRPAGSREKGQPRGSRDHFFRNFENRSFFHLIERIFPWNGTNWVQLVINALQRDVLVSRYRLRPTRVMELGTFVEDEFFTPRTMQHRAELRTRLAHILGDGERILKPKSVDSFVDGLDDWMPKQAPELCSLESGSRLELDTRALWFLQPTRVVTRKRIYRDWDLIAALFRYGPFRNMFEEDSDLTLTLHVTGPVPIEHGADVRQILEAYKATVESLPPFISRRVFQAFSVGLLGHSTFQRRRIQDLTVPDLYHLSDLVFLPSSTEGRGLPILESAAAGLPLVCSEYQPREVFERVIGRDLEPSKQIQYETFPEEEFDTALLQGITDAVFLPNLYGYRVRHNRLAVASRFSMRDLTNAFATALERLDENIPPAV